jgi:hypothetical protein
MQKTRLQALLLALAALATPAAASPQEPFRGDLGAGTAAGAGEDRVTFAELDAVLVDRFAMSESGREAVSHLVQEALVVAIAEERGISVTDAQVDARWELLDAQVRATGDREGLTGQLRAQGLDDARFREALRAAMLHEELTRRALGLADGARVTGDQQEIWIGQEISRRELDAPTPPWEDGVVAKCGEVTVRVEQYVPTLRSMVSPDDVRETCYQLLLVRRARARMPDLAPEAEAVAIDVELARRRAEAETDPRYQGVPWEEVLRARGMSLGRMRKDPAVEVAALSRLWVDRTHGEEGLKDTYRAEQRHFEYTYGEAVRGRMLFLNAAQLTNDQVPLSFAEAERKLTEWGGEVRGELDFIALTAQHEMDPTLKKLRGDTGWITRGSLTVPDVVRDAMWAALPRDREIPAEGVVTGPVRLPSGCALLLLVRVRPSPPWDEMSEHVHRELRARFLEDLLRAEDVVMWFEVG